MQRTSHNLRECTKYLSSTYNCWDIGTIPCHSHLDLPRFDGIMVVCNFVEHSVQPYCVTDQDGRCSCGECMPTRMSMYPFLRRRMARIFALWGKLLHIELSCGVSCFHIPLFVYEYGKKGSSIFNYPFQSHRKVVLKRNHKFRCALSAVNGEHVNPAYFVQKD